LKRSPIAISTGSRIMRIIFHRIQLCDKRREAHVREIVR
jgi:hypothetical protein